MGKGLSAAVFPGQGTQKIGMGKDFYDSIPESRAIFEEASDALGWDMPAMCFKENSRIHLTEFSQPLILTAEIAMFKGLQKEFGFSPQFFGGHSLGEYTALVTAEAIPFKEAVQVVHERGRLMQKAAAAGTGGMTAVIATNIDIDLIKNCIHGLKTDIANINSTDQVVISGESMDLKIAEDRISRAMSDGDPPRFVSLSVSAPFHSKMMRPVADAFQTVLETTFGSTIQPSAAGEVTSNFTGTFHSKNSETIIENLVSQISGTVQWQKNMKKLTEKVDKIYEIGPNRPLRGFFKTIGKQCSSITTLKSARRVFAKSPISKKNKKGKNNADI